GGIVDLHGEYRRAVLITGLCRGLTGRSPSVVARTVGRRAARCQTGRQHGGEQQPRPRPAPSARSSFPAHRRHRARLISSVVSIVRFSDCLWPSQSGRTPARRHPPFGSAARGSARGPSGTRAPTARAAHRPRRRERAAMRALTWQGKRDVRLETVPDPKIEEPTDAIIRVTSSGLCGSDLHLYEVLT